MYAIARVEKLTTAAALRAVGGHNARTRPTTNANPDIENRIIIDGGDDLYKTALARISNANVKPRKNAVLAMEMLLSVSPEYFRSGKDAVATLVDETRLNAWFEKTCAWLKQEYGGRIIDAVLHLDESTPHIQAVIIPLTEDGRLSARELFGRNQLRALQTNYAKVLEPLGIRRGIAGSQAKHERVNTFYGAMNAPLPESIAPVESVAIPIPPLLGRDKWADDQNTIAKTKAKSETIRLSPVIDKARSVDLVQRKIKGKDATISHLSRKVDEAELAPIFHGWPLVG